MGKRIKTYTGLVIQPAVKVAKDRDDIMANLNRVCNMIDFGVGYYWELPARIAVLPEYFLQGVTTPGKGEDGLKEFMKKAITIPGPEIEILGKKAKQYGMYIAGGGVVERLPEFPDRWFNSAFIVGPDGDVIGFLGRMDEPRKGLPVLLEAFCLLAPERCREETAGREHFAPIEQAHYGSRDLVFGGGFYCPERAGYNDISDAERLATYLDTLDPGSWTAEALAGLPELESAEERVEELEYVRAWFPALRDLYRRARAERQVVVCEVL